MATTLLQLRTRARQKADMENSEFVSDSELNTYINSGIQELYDLLVATNSDYYLSSTTSTISNGTDTIALPADFLKLKGVDFYTGGRWVELDSFNFNERNMDSVNFSIAGVEVRYMLQGSNLRLIPSSDAGGQYRIWYIPTPTELSLDADSFSGINGWEEYAVVDAAIKCLMKEESSVSTLMEVKAALRKRIQDSAPKRDSARPKTITNVSSPFKYSNYRGVRR